jgi:hypothetical protein
MWPAIAAVALSALGGLSKGAAEKANVQVSNTIGAANTYASNLMRKANNELVSKRNSLSRFVQNENNKRTMTQTGRESEATMVNYRRSRDAATSYDFEAQIGFAEQAGAQVAAGAASGLTGGISDIVGTTTALRLSRIKQATLEATKQADWDAGRRQSDILTAGLNSLDQSFIVDDLDYSLDTFVAQKPSSNTFGAILGAFTNNPGATQSLMSAGGSFFNTPSPFADRAGALGSGSDGRSRTITGGR